MPGPFSDTSAPATFPDDLHCIQKQMRTHLLQGRFRIATPAFDSCSFSTEPDRALLDKLAPFGAFVCCCGGNRLAHLADGSSRAGRLLPSGWNVCGVKPRSSPALRVSFELSERATPTRQQAASGLLSRLPFSVRRFSSNSPSTSLWNHTLLPAIE